MSTYSISGNAGVAGATVSYTGTASGSVTADGSGNYTITGLSNGSYTITPTIDGLYVLANQRKRDGERLEYHRCELHGVGGFRCIQRTRLPCHQTEQRNGRNHQRDDSL